MRLRHLVFCLAVLPSFGAAAAATPEHALAGVASYRLANGFRLILAPFPAAATARVELLVKVGSKQEGHGESGMAHLLEHMLFKRAGQRGDLKSELTRLGATWNGTTNSERTNYFETVVADPEKLDEVLRIEADRFIRPAFTADDLAREMTVVRNELERKDNDSASLVMRTLLRQSFFWHGYGRPTIGARSDIENAPFAALQAFHRRHYRPDNAVLIVSGKFDEQRVLALAEQLFSAASNPPEARPGNWTREDAQGAVSRSEVRRESGIQMAAVAWKLPGIGDRQSIAVDLAMDAFCADSWGDLRKTLVRTRQLALGTSCGVQALPDYSLFVATANGDRSADVDAMAGALKAAIDAFVRRGLTAAELERVRANRKIAFDRLFTSHEALAGRLSAGETAGDWRQPFRQQEIVEALTLDEINRALRHWLAGVPPNEAVLRHAPPPASPVAPAPDGKALVNERQWPAPKRAAAPLPESFAELAGVVREIPLADPAARASLLSRRTQNGQAWLSLVNLFGSAESRHGRQAACSLAGSLLAHGSAGIDRENLSTRLEKLQARVSFSLGRISIAAPTANLAAALDLLLAVRQSPALPPEEFERLRAAGIAAIDAAMKQPEQVAGNALLRRFDNYPADHPARPSSFPEQLAELRAVTLDDVRRCIADFGGRSTVHLAVVGDLDADDVQRLWEKIGSLPPAALPYRRSPLPAPPGTVDSRDIVVSLPDKPNASLMARAELPIRWQDADFPALSLAVRLLGGDNDSRIRQRLRESEGLSYSAGASLAPASFEARSPFSISASVASEHAEKARDMLREELARALESGFSDDEVARARQAWQDQRRRIPGQESRLAEYMVSALHGGRDFAREAELDTRIASLKRDEVNAALRKYLGAAPLVWAIGKGG